MSNSTADLPGQAPLIKYDALSFTGAPDFWSALERFRHFNDQVVAECIPWNTNDVLFIQWMLQMHPRDVQCETADVRARIGILACRHGHVIAGTQFVSLEEKEEALIREISSKLRRGDYFSPMRSVPVPEDSENIADAIVRTWKRQTNDSLLEVHKQMIVEYNKEQELRIKGRSSYIDFTLLDVMAQLASVIRRFWVGYEGGAIPCAPSQQLLLDIEHLRNGAVGAQQGSYVSTEHENWLPFATHAVTHLYLEQSLLLKWPMRRFDAFSGEQIEGFNKWVAGMFSTEIPQQIIREIREEVCDYFMPAGARTYCRRVLRRSNVREDVICQHVLGTNPTSEMISHVEDEVKIKCIAEDPGHALFDVLAMTAVSWYCHTAGHFDFSVDVLLANSDLIDCYGVFSKASLFGGKRGPLICNVQGWKVHYDESWYDTGNFATSWLLWLILLDRHHSGRTMHGQDVGELIAYFTGKAEA